MREAQTDHRAAATEALGGIYEGGKGVDAVLVQVALTHAVLAVADELADLRKQVTDVVTNLEDQDRYPAGQHLRNISDWLEKLVKCNVKLGVTHNLGFSDTYAGGGRAFSGFLGEQPGDAGVLPA